MYIIINLELLLHTAQKRYVGNFRDYKLFAGGKFLKISFKLFLTQLKFFSSCLLSRRVCRRWSLYRRYFLWWAWVVVDDVRVSPISTQHVLETKMNRVPYLLLYRRVDAMAVAQTF